MRFFVMNKSKYLSIPVFVLDNILLNPNKMFNKYTSSKNGFFNF